VDEHQREVLSRSDLFSVSDPVNGYDPERPDLWPFPFATDQQMFCDAKGIPYVLYHAQRRP
jgi:hypothetical protein